MFSRVYERASIIRKNDTNSGSRADAGLGVFTDVGPRVYHRKIDLAVAISILLTLLTALVWKSPPQAENFYDRILQNTIKTVFLIGFSVHF